MIEVWEHLDCESVGARELEEIQRVVSERFGAGAVASPAAIARTLADEGAVLRHPEVLECDAHWRGRETDESIFQEDLSFSTLEQASDSIKKLESLRKEFEDHSDRQSLQRLRSAVLRHKEDCLLLARSKAMEEGEQTGARETARWLTVWLQQPEVFADWLSLRKRSPEFRQLFPRQS